MVQNIYVTGGQGDIGQAIAQRLMQDGFRVTLVDLVPGEAPKGCESVRCDITVREEVEQLFAGNDEVYAVIANAGVVLGAPFLSQTLDDWERTMAVNLTGSFHVAQCAARKMALQAPDPNGVRGKILFTSSWVQERPCPRSAAYAASKAGVHMLAQCMAQELAAEGILVNLVAPGAVDAGITRRTYRQHPEFREEMAAMVPLQRLQPATSVAGAFSYLCSSDADHMTGATMRIDGGLSLLSCNV